MTTSFSGGRSQGIRREPQTMGKQLVNFITQNGAASRVHPFCNLQSRGNWSKPNLLRTNLLVGNG